MTNKIFSNNLEGEQNQKWSVQMSGIFHRPWANPIADKICMKTEMDYGRQSIRQTRSIFNFVYEHERN